MPGFNDQGMFALGNTLFLRRPQTCVPDQETISSVNRIFTILKPVEFEADMTEHPLRLVRENFPTVKHEKAKHHLGSMDSAKYAKHLALFRANAQMLNRLVELAAAHIPGMAGLDTVRRVLEHNPDCVWAIARRSKYNPAVPTGEGF